MQGRRQVGLEPKTRLSPESRDMLIEKASCRLVVKFHDGNTWSKWSNEHKQAWKLVNISDSVNEMFRIFEKSFRKYTHSAAIFDTRESKKIGAHNKIYQFENGVWKTVNPFYW